MNNDALSTFLLNRPQTDLAHEKNHCRDITELTASETELEAFGARLRNDHGDISLVVGGPPCQGYSGIGHRRTFNLHKNEIPSNYLFAHMAKVVEAVAPKAFVFENVRGLLTSRWTKDGRPGEIWEDVQEAFRQIDIRSGRKRLTYDIHWAPIYARSYGVPQNRPRLLMVGIRSDIQPTSLESGLASAGGFLPLGASQAPDPVELLGDLVDEAWQPGGTTSRYPNKVLSAAQLELRTRPDGTVARRGDSLTEQQYSNHSPLVMEKFLHMLRYDGRIPPSMRTRKFAQRVIPERWGPAGPNITATSLPDDYVHFSLPRTPTVREWARLQTFPDWYQFSGPRTTGGRRRAGDPSIDSWRREVPRYTQIGNAVPVGLGRAIGQHLSELLSL